MMMTIKWISNSLLGIRNPFYGHHHSEETKKRLRMLCGHKIDDSVKEKLKIKNLGKGNPFYGKHHTEITKRKISESTIRTHTGKKFSVQRRMRLAAALRGIHKSEEHKRKIGINSKIRIIKLKEDLGILKIGFNPSACKYFDILNETNGWNLQHAMNGGEKRILCYFVDAFDKDRNIVIEYDEPHHFTWNGKLCRADIVRMNDIISHTGCKFLRYNETDKELKEYVQNEIISD